MNFRRGFFNEEPEINLVPFIDILIVIVIFLAVTTTYSKYTQLQINLPTAEGKKTEDDPTQINVGISKDGKYLVNRNATNYQNPVVFASELQRAARGYAEPVVVINADAKAPHQAVINVMESARIAGYSRITFSTQK